MAGTVDQPEAARQIPGASLASLIVVGVLCFLAGLIITLVVNNWDRLSTLYVEASLARYEAMTAGLDEPTDYWVFHDDLEVVNAIASEEDAITKVEATSLDHLAVVSFTSARNSAVNRLREHPSVTAILSTSIPLFCH